MRWEARGAVSMPRPQQRLVMRQGKASSWQTQASLLLCCWDQPPWTHTAPLEPQPASTHCQTTCWWRACAL